jgi:phosphoribosylformimino-5-aminoimidazole carboxamide ribonucleotide (ProFAR) isomerase
MEPIEELSHLVDVVPALTNSLEDATLRLRVRTTATRIQIGGGGKDSSRGAPVIVPQRR